MCAGEGALSSNLYCIIVAAGSGERLGQNKPKALVEVLGESILVRSLRLISESVCPKKIIITCPAGYLGVFQSTIDSSFNSQDLKIIEGGATRQLSVYLALKELANTASKNDHVLIHDAARCFMPKEVIKNTAKALNKFSAVTTALPVTDTIKRVSVVESDIRVKETLVRDTLYKIQTPQGFHFGIIFSAHVEAKKIEQIDAVDDASLVEGHTDVFVVRGDELGFKITTPLDLKLAKLLDNAN